MPHQRILLKLSGEALMGQGAYGIDPEVIRRLAGEIHGVVEQGVQVGLVIGGGNILRGAGLASQGMNRVTGDHMGMLATVINALAMQDAIEQAGTACQVMSALTMDQVCESYTSRKAIDRLEQGMSLVHATLYAARRRIVPIIITSLTTVAGLFSLAVGLGGQSLLWGPVATSIVWGLSFSTILTVFSIPLIYRLTMSGSKRVAQKG